MSGWVRVDTKFTTHPKVLDIGPLGEALWLRGLCYAGEHLTDGFVPAAFVRRMSDMDGEDVADRLLDAGLWTQAEGGYQIHEYLSWQRSRDEAADISIKRSESGRKGGLQRSSNLQANGKQVASKPRKQNASKTQADTDTDTDTDTELTLLGKESLRENQQTPPEPPKPATKRKSQVPEDWQPSEKGRDYALAKGMAAADIPHEVGKFRNHHRSRGTLFLDIDAAWRTWSDNHAQFSRARAPNANGRHIEARDNYGDFSGPDKGGTIDPDTGEPIPIHKWGNR
jgi:hypothetical protein